MGPHKGEEGGWWASSGTTWEPDNCKPTLISSHVFRHNTLWIVERLDNALFVKQRFASTVNPRGKAGHWFQKARAPTSAHVHGPQASLSMHGFRMRGFNPLWMEISNLRMRMPTGEYGGPTSLYESGPVQFKPELFKGHLYFLT